MLATPALHSTRLYGPPALRDTATPLTKGCANHSVQKPDLRLYTPHGSKYACSSAEKGEAVVTDPDDVMKSMPDPEAQEIFNVLGANPGSLGAVGVTQLSVYADERLRGANDMTTGANQDGFHLKSVSIDRDIAVTRWADLRTVSAGEPCAKCAKPLKIRRAIEVGHVFKLGTKYSEKLNATFLAEDGQRHPCVMGCYGIGVTRTLQAIIEQNNDKDGILWPVTVAPYTVCITPLGVAPESAVMQLAQKLYAELSARGVDVILDDRDERPGVKFKDSELVGFPIRIGIGEKSLAKGEVELKPRNGALQAIKTEDAVEAVMKLVNGSLRFDSSSL